MMTYFPLQPSNGPEGVHEQLQERRMEAEESVSDNPFKKGEAFEISLSSNLKDIRYMF